MELTKLIQDSSSYYLKSIDKTVTFNPASIRMNLEIERTIGPLNKVLTEGNLDGIIKMCFILMDKESKALFAPTQVEVVNDLGVADMVTMGGVELFKDSILMTDIKPLIYSLYLAIGAEKETIDTLKKSLLVSPIEAPTMELFSGSPSLT